MEEAGSTEREWTYEDEALAARVERAFDGVSCPGDDRLVLDLRHFESGETVYAFAGRHWKELPLDFLSVHLMKLHNFTPEAFCYYLPAYLLASLKELSPEEAETGVVNIPESLVYHLTPPKQEGRRLDDFRARVSGLTLEQKRVIRDFLRWLDRTGKEWERKYLPEYAQQVVEEDEQEIALKQYWENIK